MAAPKTREIVRFNPDKGYEFIAPDAHLGGVVSLHVSIFGV